MKFDRSIDRKNLYFEDFKKFFKNKKVVPISSQQKEKKEDQMLSPIETRNDAKGRHTSLETGRRNSYRNLDIMNQTLEHVKPIR
jgi:hypothetical protein